MAGGLTYSTAHAATNTVNFNNAAAALPYVEVGAAAAEYRADGGASGAAGDGYLSVTDARSGQRATVVFNDLDNGLVVKAFVFEADLRIGGGTARPADGFSLNYVRAGDPLIADGSPFAGTGNETNLPEEGSLTGLGIGFDTWQSGDHPGGITDVVGLSIRVDGELITQLPVPLRPGNVWPGGTFDEVPYRNLATTDANYALSMQTGALNTTDDLNGDGSNTPGDADAPQPPFADDPVVWAKWVKNLKWERIRAEITELGRVKISWKGVELTPAGGLSTTFAPSPGRVVFGARTGGAWEAHHVDNLYLATVPADSIIVGSAVGNPIGFTITSVDSGSGIAVTDGLVVTLNGTPVTPTVSKDGITLTATFGNAAAPLAVGSTNTVVMTVRDTLGRSVTETRTFTVAPYVTIPPAYAVSSASGSGFNFRIHQTAQRGQPTTIARAEQQLAGLRGANVADLTGATSGNLFTPSVINFNQPAADGSPSQDGFFNGNQTNPDRQIADVLIPGIPSQVEFDNGNSYTDNAAAEITTYLQFPTAGVYTLSFNSDDGFRTTVAANNAEVLTSLIVSEADFGKGASDVNATVYVPQAGFYPFRSVWFEGGGGANLEWSAQRVAPSPTARYLINDANPAAVKAFRTSSASAPAAVSFIHPFRASGNDYLGTVPIVATIVAGASPVDQGSITVLLDGAAVSATKTPSGNTTSVSFDPPGNLSAGNHSVVLRFTAGAQNYDATNTFRIANAPVVSPSLALPASAVNTANRGFLVKTVQQANGESMGNDTARGLTHVAGLIGTPNRADLTAFTGPQGYFVETGVINYNQDATSSGFFPDDTGVPGIPGLPNADGSVTGGNGTDNFAQEILTVLQLNPGYYRFNVNSDDGFVATIGNPAEAFTLPLVIGEFSGGRGNGGGVDSGTTFSFEVTQAGLYPVRLVWYEGGGGANVEFSARQFDPVTGASTGGNLINSAEGIVAYQYPLGSAGVPYVKSFTPARTGRASGVAPYRAGTDAAITVVVPQGTGPALTTANVTLNVDGTVVTPTINTAGGVATISYAPAAGWVAGSTHTNLLTIIDRTVSWTFGIGNIKTPTFFIEAEDFDNSGAGLPVASVMPYAGGAFAGLGATATDYIRNNEGASPLYRIGETPQVPMDRTGDRDRGLGEIAVNYKIGWAGGDGWYNYTRTFPAGRYNVYAGLSHGDGPASATRMAATLSTVSGGTATQVGTFEAPATGGWGNNALVPLKASNTDTTPLVVNLSGSQTLRFATGNGDFDFILFSPAATEAPRFTSIVRNANGSITLTWTGGGTLQSGTSINGPFAPVAGATSPFTFTPDPAQPTLFGRIVQ